MTHTVHLLTGQTHHVLPHVDDATAREIIRWWAPDGKVDVVDEYFYKAIKDGEELKRVIMLRRTSLAAIEINPETEVAPAVAPAPVAAPMGQGPLILPEVPNG